MRTPKKAASCQTMTDGSRLSRAEQILSLAQASAPTNWFAALPPEDRDLLVEIRDRWRATRNASGVSAASIAKTIIAQMPEHRFPAPKSLAEWLNRSGGERTKS